MKGVYHCFDKPEGLPLPVPTPPSTYLTRLRVQLLDDILLSLALISTPALVLSLSRIPVMGWRPVFAMHIVGMALLWGSWIARRRIPYAIRLWTVLIALGGVGLGGYLQHGPAAVAGQFVLLFLVVAALFLPGRAALFSGVMLVLLLGGAGYAAVQGLLDFQLDYARYANDPATWVLLMVATAGYGGAVAMITARLVSEADHHERELADTNDELRQRNRDADAANRLKGEILANLSHEFRTPLNGILGMADLLQMTDEDPERQAWITELQHSARRLDRMLDRMLDFVALGEGTAPLNTGPFDLCELVATSVRAFQAQAREKLLELATECTPDVSTLVIGDGSRLRQMIGELMANAIAFTDRGAIRCHVSREPSPVGDAREWIRLELSDTGIGIAPEQQEQVFEPFYQVDGTATRQSGGNGIGLPLCRRIAHLMGGRISLASVPGQGTRVAIVLPFTVPR